MNIARQIPNMMLKSIIPVARSAASAVARRCAGPARSRLPFFRGGSIEGAAALRATTTTTLRLRQGERLFHAGRVLPVQTIPFNLADIGEGIAEVEILQWFVKEGDEVKEFDPICEVQSDKATVEITSRFQGKVVRVCHEVGALAPVGTSLVDLEVSDEVASAAGGGAAASAREPEPAAAAAPEPAVDAAAAAAAVEAERSAHAEAAAAAAAANAATAAAAAAAAANASAATAAAPAAPVKRGQRVLTTPATRK